MKPYMVEGATCPCDKGKTNTVGLSSESFDGPCEVLWCVCGKVWVGTQTDSPAVEFKQVHDFSGVET